MNTRFEDGVRCSMLGVREKPVHVTLETIEDTEAGTAKATLLGPCIGCPIKTGDSRTMDVLVAEDPHNPPQITQCSG